MQSTAPVKSLVAPVVAVAACVSRQTPGTNCTFESRGLVAVMSQVDAASRDTAPATEDAGADRMDAASERGCVDGSLCPKGTVLFMAAHSTPCAERTIVCRRSPSVPARPHRAADVDDVWADTIWLSGDLTRADIDAIAATVAHVDVQPLLSVHRRGDAADAKTGCTGACSVGSGWAYILRKIHGAWIIVERSQWIE